MQNQTGNRRRWALAAVLALIAAATLCVWGAAAAGLRFTSPALEAAIQAFSEARVSAGEETAVDVSSKAGGDGSVDANDGEVEGGDNMGAVGTSRSGSGISSDSSTAAASCFLGIFCLNLSADANTNASSAGGTNVSGLDGLSIQVDADANSSGVDLDADVDVATDVGAQPSRCFLGLLCINFATDAAAAADVHTNSALQVDLNGRNTLTLGADANADVDLAANVDAAANTQPNWLSALLSLFVGVN